VICFGISSGIENGKRNLIRVLKTVLGMPKYSFINLMMKNRSVSGLNALYFFDDEKWMKRLLPELQNTKAIPHVDSAFPAREAWKAHQHLEDRKAKGKVLLSWLD